MSNSSNSLPSLPPPGIYLCQLTSAAILGSTLEHGGKGKLACMFVFMVTEGEFETYLIHLMVPMGTLRGLEYLAHYLRVLGAKVGGMELEDLPSHLTDLANRHPNAKVKIGFDNYVSIAGSMKSV